MPAWCPLPWVHWALLATLPGKYVGESRGWVLRGTVGSHLCLTPAPIPSHSPVGPWSRRRGQYQYYGSGRSHEGVEEAPLQG